MRVSRTDAQIIQQDAVAGVIVFCFSSQFFKSKAGIAFREVKALQIYCYKFIWLVF